MQLFYSNQTSGNQAFLDAEETRHCKVLRKNEGDTIQVINGLGHLMDCKIIHLKKDSAELEILNEILYQRSRTYYFHLYIAPTKNNERIEWMLEKAIEAGLDEITFIETAHSEKNRINLSRLQKIAVSAMKQSGQYYLPLINPMIRLAQVQIDAQTLLAHCGPGMKKSLMDAVYPIKENSNISILIGPEGDFSGAEVADMLQKGASVISLGNSRLRTETAGLYCAIMLNGLS